MTTLAQKKADFTRNLLLDSAAELLTELGVSELSFRSVSAHAGVSERTMFRYFENRDTFLDELTPRLHARLGLPELPDDSSGCTAHLGALYQQLEKHRRLVDVLLSAEFFPRVLDTTASARLERIIALLEKDYPRKPEDLILKTAANLRYIMSASSWRYYRRNFGFDLETSIACATMLIQQALSFLETLPKQNS